MLFVLCALVLSGGANLVFKGLVVLLELDDFVEELGAHLLALLVVVFELELGLNADLHLGGQVLLLHIVVLVLLLNEVLLHLKQLRVELLYLYFLLQILLRNVLVLLTSVAQNYHRRHYLLPKLVELVVSLFDLVVQSLVFDLKLFKIDQVEAVG